MKRVLAVAALMLVAHGQAAIVTNYQPPADDESKALKVEIEESGVNEKLADLSAQYFPFDPDLTIEYRNDGDPLYDPLTHTIHMPYRFYAQIRAYFTDDGYTERPDRSAGQGALDTLLYTLLHESAHAYIASQDIAVLGKEEDAADDFASVILLNGLEDNDGGEIAISAADMFMFAANNTDRPDYYEPIEYIDDHSFDLQRYFSTLCLVYGSNPEKYTGLLDDISEENRSEREEFCQMRFYEATGNWSRYLTDKSAHE